MNQRSWIIAIVLALFSVSAAAEKRHSGPIFTDFGSWRTVENMQPLNSEEQYKAIFDVVPGSRGGAVNSRFDSAARYINLIVANGVPRENVSVAVVVHGPSVWDVTTDEAYAREHPGEKNPNSRLVSAMITEGEQFYVCGQSAIGQGVTNTDLLPGVVMTLSQTVATTILHNNGYTNIP